MLNINTSKVTRGKALPMDCKSLQTVESWFLFSFSLPSAAPVKLHHELVVERLIEAPQEPRCFLPHRRFVRSAASCARACRIQWPAKIHVPKRWPTRGVQLQKACKLS
jgi:hypothetical protein